MTPDQLKDVLTAHAQWLKDPATGKQATLRWAKLQGADLQGTDLRWAKLQGTDLRGIDLRGAIMCDKVNAVVVAAVLRGVEIHTN